MINSISKNNDFTLCLLIIVIFGLFLYYEFGFKFNLFQVGAPGKHHPKKNRFRDRHNPRHYYNHFSNMWRHDPSINQKYIDLKDKHDKLESHHGGNDHDHGDKGQSGNLSTGGIVHSITTI